MDTFIALSEPTRRRILEILSGEGPQAATDLYKRFTASSPAISQHLHILRDTNLVRVERRAQKRIYYVNPEPMREIERWVSQFTKMVEERFEALDEILEKEKKRITKKGDDR